MSTITEFLLARISEEEAYSGNVMLAVHTIGGVPETRYQSIQGWVLVECEAKRRIVERVTRAIREAVEETDQQHGWVLDGVVEAMVATAKDLAQPYADHPDFQDEWRNA